MTYVYVVAKQTQYEGYGYPQAVFATFEALIADYPKFDMPACRKALDNSGEWGYSSGRFETVDVFRMELVGSEALETQAAFPTASERALYEYHRAKQAAERPHVQAMPPAPQNGYLG